jgi:hypothetical protein
VFKPGVITDKTRLPCTLIFNDSAVVRQFDAIVLFSAIGMSGAQFSASTVTIVAERLPPI